MSEETANQKKTQDSETPGFRTALYFNLEENPDSRVKEVTDTLGLMRLNSTDYSQTPTMTPRQSDTYKDYISADLLKRLEESSPIKYRKSEEYMRRLSEMYLSNYDGEDASNLSKRGSNTNIEELPNSVTKEFENKRDHEGKVITNLPNYATRNFKLKSHVINSNEDDTLQEYAGIGLPKMKTSQKSSRGNRDEPQSLFTNSMNFSTGNNSQQPNTNFSPTYTTKQQKHSRRDSSPIYTYYDGTAECLSQTFYDEFKKSNNDQFMSKNNFIKKEPVILEEQNNIGNEQEGSNKYSKAEDSPYGLNFNFFQGNMSDFKNGMPHVDNYGNVFTQGYENPGNLRDNIGVGLGPHGMNYMRNQGSNIVQGSLRNPSKKEYPMQGRQINVITHNNHMDFSEVNSVNSEGASFSGNPNQIHYNYNNNSRDGSTPMKSYQMNNKNSQKQGGSPIDSVVGNPFQACVSNTSNQYMDPEDYTVEMFGRKGWICEMCNNFNYETRQKCNRCGIVKTPKRIKNKHGKNDSSELDDSTERKKKKPFVERVGDWVCIKCKNLNFSFRVVCNRCQLPKAESDKMFESYMGNLMNYVKINEMMQQRIIQSNQQTPPGFVNNNSININNNYYGNPPQGSSLNGKNLNMNKHGGVPFSGNGASFYNSGMGMSNFGNVSNNGSVGGIPFQLGNVKEDGDYYNEEN